MGSTNGHTGLINAVAYSADGTRIISGSEDGSICVWDGQTGAIVAGPLCAHHASIVSVAYSPDTHIATGSNDHTIRVWCLDQLVQGPGTTWKLVADGWMIDSSSQRLVCLPLGLRDKVRVSSEVLYISEDGLFSLNFDNACVGRSWANIYM